jgi:hypothetical protein
LVENDGERQAEPPVDTIDAFLKSTATTAKTFSPCHQNICKSRIFATISEVEKRDEVREWRILHN